MITILVNEEKFPLAAKIQSRLSHSIGQQVTMLNVASFDKESLNKHAKKAFLFRDPTDICVVLTKDPYVLESIDSLLKNSQTCLVIQKTKKRRIACVRLSNCAFH